MRYRYWTPEKIDETFDQMVDELGRMPTQKEFSKCYPGAFVKIRRRGYMPNIKTWADYVRHRGLGQELSTSPRYDSGTKVNIVELYLFGKENRRRIAKNHEISDTSIKTWSYDSEIIETVANRRGIPEREVRNIRDSKTKSFRKSHITIPYEKKVEIAEIYLFTDKNPSELAEEFNVSPDSIRTWSKKPDILTEIAKRRETNLEEIHIVRREKLRLFAGLFNSFPEEFKIKVAEEYLLGKNGTIVIGKKYSVSPSIVSSWSEIPLILQEIAKRNNLSIDKITDLRKQKGAYKGRWTPEVIDNAFDRMVGELVRRPTFDEFRERFPSAIDNILKGRYDNTIKSWSQYLTHRNYHQIKDAPTFREFIETNETAQMFVRVLGGSPAALGRALAIKYQGRLVAEDVPDYLPSLGPYLGIITVSPPPPGPGGFEGVLIELPLEAILEDQLLRDTFLNMGRDYYFSLIESEHPTEEDRQTLTDMINANVEETEHPSLKWLHQTLFDEFSRFHELARELAGIKAKINGDS